MSHLDDLEILRKASKDIRSSYDRADLVLLDTSLSKAVKIVQKKGVPFVIKAKDDSGPSSYFILVPFLIIGWISAFIITLFKQPGKEILGIYSLSIPVFILLSGAIALFVFIKMMSKPSPLTQRFIFYFDEICKSISDDKIYFENNSELINSSFKDRFKFLIGKEYESKFEGKSIKLFDVLFVRENNNVGHGILLSNEYVSKKLNIIISSVEDNINELPYGYEEINNAFRLSALNKKFNVFAKKYELSKIPTLITPRFEDDFFKIIEKNWFSAGLYIEINNGNILLYSDSEFEEYKYRENPDIYFGSREKIQNPVWKFGSVWPLPLEAVTSTKRGLALNNSYYVDNAKFMHSVLRCINIDTKNIRKKYDYEHLIKMILSNVDDNYR